jgi:hypothetical protein
VRAKGLLGDILQGRFLESYMAGRAAIYNALIGQPKLLDSRLKTPFEGTGVGAAAHQAQVLALIMTPRTEKVLSARYHQQSNKQQADGAEGARTVAEKPLPERTEFFPDCQRTPPRALPP